MRIRYFLRFREREGSQKLSRVTLGEKQPNNATLIKDRNTVAFREGEEWEHPAPFKTLVGGLSACRMQHPVHGVETR